MMHLNTHYQHTKDVLNRNLMRLGFVVFILLMVSSSFVSAQKNVEVCRDGVIRLEEQLKDPQYMGAGNDAPPGHLQKGYWSNTAGLTFSDINDPNAIISGFDFVAPGTTYTLTWFHADGQTYDITVQVSNNIAPQYDLHNEDGNTANVLFCTTPNNYDFTVVPSATNPAATISAIDYIVYHQDGSTPYKRSPATNPETFNLNNSTGYQDLDVYSALVSNGTCLDITTNTIQLSQISSVVVQIQGDLSSCDPNVFDGSHILEVLPFDPNNFDYQWQFNGANIAGATSSTYTLSSTPGEGSYTVTVTNKTDPTCGTTTEPVVVSVNPLPQVSIVDNPAGSGTFEICDGATNIPMNTSLSGGTVPAVFDYDWYQNGTLVSGNNSSYLLNNDDTDADGDDIIDDPNYNAFGDYYVVYKDADNIECKSYSTPVSIVSTVIDNVTMLKGNNATPFCGSGTPRVAVTVNGGSAPYTLTFSNGYSATLPSNGASINLPAITATTTFNLISVVDNSSGCSWTGNETQTFNVATAPLAYSMEDASGSINPTVNACMGSSVGLYLSDTELNVNYQVYDSSNTPIGGLVAGTGNPILLTTVNTAGVFNVVGTSTTNGCQTTMGSMTVNYVTPPTGSIRAGQAFEKCNGSAATFGVTIDITPTNQGPWDLVITDGSNDYNFTATTSTDTWTTPNVGTTRTFTIKSIEDRNGCTNTTTNTGSVTITINPTPTITLIGPDDVCIGDAPISITADITPVGTVINRYEWSTGIVDNGKQTITVSPNNIPTHTYSVEVETDKGCINTQSKDITVHPLPVVSFDSDGSKYVFCMDDTPASLTGSPLGGKFYVDGVELGANSFNPASYTQGDHNVEYFYQDGNGCESSFLRVFTVNAVPNVTLSGLQNQYCADAGGVTIQGSPDGSAYVPPIPGTFTSNPSHSSYFTDNGDGTADFDVASAISVQGPGNYIFTYTYTNNEGCDASATYTTTLLNDLGSTLSFSGLPANICQTASPVTLIPYNSGVQITPAPGTTISFTGPAGSITYDASNGTAEFDPAVAGAGNYTITLNYSDANGCTGSVTNTIQVGTPISIPGLGTEYCSSNSTPFTLTGQVNGAAPPAPDLTTFDIYAPDGTTAVALNQANGTYDFIPSTLFGNYGGGVYKVHYKYEDATGCINTLISNVTIIEELNAVFTIGGDPYATAQANYCDNDSPVDLEGHADLGTALGTVSSVFTGNGVSGNGVSGGFFNPQDASVQLYPNTNTITHTVFHTVNGLSCPSTPETFDVTVVPVQVNISGLSATKKYCTNDGTSVITVSGADASGGTATFTATKNGSASVFIDDNGDNTADIDPSVGAGIYVITMTFEKTADGCEKTITETVEVFADNPVTFSGVTDNQKICQSSDPITLRGDMFAGGVGNFIEISPGLLNTGTDDLGNAVIADDGKAVLTPGAMTLGPHTIIYEFTNANGCTTTESKDIEIVSAPTDTYIVTGGGAYCIDDSPKGMTIGLSGSNSGVTYELLFGGSSLTPKVEYVSTGGAFNFTVNSDGTGGDQLFDKEGVYTVKAVLGGCDAYMTGSVTIEQYELVLQQVSKDNISCNGLSDGTVTLLATGGSGSYEYAVDGGTWQASPTFTGLSLGDHDFSVKDLSSAACEAIDVLTINITQPSAISITEIENIPVGCAGCSVAGGTCEGSSTITISGGTPDLLTYPGVGYGVLWSNGQTGLTATNLPTGTHSVTVTDGNGCTQNFGVVISTVTPTLSLDENIGDHIDNVCNNGADGQYIVTATGGTGTYEFTTTDPTDPTAVWVPGNVTADQYRVQGLEDGTYLVWVRDADPIVDYSRCYTQVTTPIIILEPAALSLVEDSKIGITCSGNTDGSFVVKASGGESADYEFSEVNPSVAVAADWKPESGIDTYELIGKGAGTYRVWVRDASYPGCGTSFVDVTLSPIDPFTFIVDEHKNVSCNSYNDGRLEVTAQGGSGNYVYQWEYPDASIVNSNLIDLLYAGDYNLTIIDNDPLSTCADLVQTFTITQPDVLTIQNENIFSADCENTGSIQLEVVGGTPPYNINWSDGTNQVLANPGIISVSGLAPGNYTIDITDANLCNFNNVGSEFVVGQNNPITLLLPATVINNSCNGGISGSIYVQVEGGSGDYQFRLEGPVIRDWSNSTSATMDDFTFAGLVEGNYDVKVRDANNTNCVYTVGSYTLVDPAPLGLVTNSISDVTCFGDNDGSFTVTASGGSGTYQFNVDNTGYNTGDNPALFTKDFLFAGDHTVWVRDSKATGCQYQLHPVVTVDQVGVLGLSIDSYQDVSCHDGQDGKVVLVATGGSGDYEFSKDGGATWDVATSNTLTYDKLFDGTYDFRVRDRKSLSCTPVSVIHDVEEPLKFTTSATPTHVKCRGDATGQIVLTTTYSDLSAGAFTYSIDGGTTWLASPITGLTAGTYSIDVKDETTECIITNAIPAGVTITQPTSSITIGNEVITNVSCYDGANGVIDLQGTVNGGTVAAGSDYYYTWYKKGTPDLIQNQGSDLDRITGLSEGTYFVVVKDDNQCEETSDEFIITQPSDWNVDYTASDLTKYNGADGVIDVHTHTGSNPDHTIKWYSVESGVENYLSTYDNVWTVNTLPAGTYRFKIADDLNCTYVSDDINLTQPLEFKVTDPNSNKTNVTCYDGNNGIIKVEILSGNGNFTLNVTGTLADGSPFPTYDETQSGSNFELTDLYAGQYNINVTDNSTSESKSFIVEITQPNQLTVDLVSSQDITCNGGDDGEIVVEINGATFSETASTISWTRNPVGWSVSGTVDDGTTDLRQQTDLYAGVYTVNVLSEKGCSATPLTVTLTEKDAITATQQVTHVTTNGGNNGRIYVNNIVSVDVINSVLWYKKDASGTYIATGATGIDNDNIEAGIYRYVITDTEGCTFTSDDILVTEPGQALAVDVTDFDINCYGDASGVITVNITTGVGPFSVELSGTHDDGTPFTAQESDKSYTEFTDLKAGTYQITVTDDAGQSYTKNDIVISENPETILSISPTDIHCYGETSTVQLSLSGRTNGTESWQLLDPELGEVYNGPLSGNNIQTIGLEGEYTIALTNQDGCILTDKVTINEPEELVAEWTPTDATIYDLNNGIIDVHTVTGGNGAPYTISWADDVSVTDFLRNDLLAGSYTFTIEDNDGCTVSHTVVIGQPNPLTVVVTPKNATCYGYNDGSIDVKIAIPNNGGLNYRIIGNEDDGDSYDSNIITPTSVNSTVAKLEAGTYTIDAYDSKGTHYHQEDIRIEQEALVTITGTPKDITCFGDADGRIVVALNGRAPLSTDVISWSGSNGYYLSGQLYDDVAGTYINNQIDPVLVPEIFNVTVTSAQGCTYNGEFEVKQPNEIVITVDDVEDVTCVKGTDGSIDISVTGRAGGGYTYVWEKKDVSGVYQPYAGNSASLAGLSAGEYQVTVKSITDNCEATYSDIEVLDGSEITINETLTHIASCVGDNSGVITVSVEDGFAPFKVNVTGQPMQTGDGSTAFVFDELYAGNYVIEVSDARGVSCATVTKNVTITEPAVAFDVTNPVHNIDCDPVNSTSGTFTFNITGGVPVGGNYRYQILLPEASIAKPVTNGVGSTYTENINGLDAGTYNLTVLDLNSTDPATCAFKYQFTLEHIVISNDPVVHTTCKGVNNGAITGISIDGASANYTYDWSTTDGGIGIDNTTLNQSGLSPGTYVLTITDPDRAGCAVSKTFTVGVDNTIVVNPTIKDVSCNGGTDGAVSIDVSGISPITSYTWTGPGIVDGAQKDQVNLPSGNYAVEITTTIDGQTCVANRVYTVAQPNPISYTAKYNYTDCEPFVRTLVLEDVKGGTGNYTYLWDGPAFDPVVPVDPKDVEIREGGIYSITVKDENQCELTKTLSVPYEISIDPVINDVTCNGGNTGSIVLNVAGGTGQYTFSWTGPDGYTSTDRNIDELYAGEYTVVITDQNENDGTANCFREFTLIVEEPSPIEIVSTVENTSCFGASDGLIEIEVSGGTAPYTYNWSPVVGANLATNRNQYNLPADTYTVTVTDAAGKGGCIATKNIEVKQDAQIILSTDVTDTQCDGTAGAIDLTATGGSGAGFAYDWSSADGSGLVQGDQDQSGLSGGTFTVVVSDLGDGRSCKATISETLTHEIEVINEVVSPVSCSGNDDGSISYDVTGGDGNYIYTWNVVSGDATRIVAGSRNQSGLSEGEYEVTITDGRTVGATDCAITHTFIVPATTGLSVNVAVEDSKMCFGESGGKLTAAVTGGSGDYKYIWNGVEGTNVLDNLVQGIYGLEVVDNVLGCSYIQSYEIKGPDAPLTIDNIVVTDVLCYNDNTGAIQVSVSGGTEPSTGYIYTWTGGAGAATGSNPGNLFAGTYNLTVTDDNGCTVESGPIIVTQPTSYIKVDNPQITDVTTAGGTNGQILVDVYDGVAPRSVEWFDASNVSLGTLNPVTGLTAGTYRVVATDDNGCSAELTGLRVVQPGEALGFEKTVHQISPCNGADNGEIHINRIFGGYPIDGNHYGIQITGPGTNVNTTGTSYDLTGLAPGTYIITVTDDVSVTYQEQIEIIEYPSLTLNTSKVSDVDCFGGSNGSIQVEVSGGQADASNHYLVEITSAEGYYNYKDDVVANTVFAFSNLPAGNYTVRLIDHAEDFDTKVPDRGNCELSEFTLITEPSALVELNAVGGDNEMCRGESVDLSLSISNWDFAIQGNLRVAVYDNFTTKEYVVDESPYIITEAPASSRTYKVTNVVDPSNATCAQGESTGSQVQVLVHELPTANITGPTEVCEDGTITLNVAFTGSQPFSFTWQDVNNGTSNTVTGITSNSYTFTDEPIADASYIILDVSDDHTCTNVGNGQVDVTINNKPVVTLSGSTDICFGETTPLTIGFNENKAPYTITYEANGVEGTLVVTPDASFNYTWNVSPNVTTTYEITTVIDSKGCVMDMVVPVQATVIVDQLPDPLDEITSSSDNGEVCQGISGIDYSVAIVDYATNYVWSVDAGMNITSGNGTNNITIDFDRDFAGGYIRVYAENDCGVSPVIERWVNSKVLPDPILSAPTGPTQLCQSATGVIYSINPVDNATSYEWSLPTGLVLRGDGSGTSIIVDLDPDVPTTVGDILVRPINDCSNTEPWSPALTVTINPLPTSYAGPDDRICQTTYTLNADPLNAGETGLWTIGGGSVQFNNKAVDQIRPNAQIYNLSQGDNTFTWTVTNQYGCSVSDEVVISNDQVSVNASVSDTEVCDGTVTLYGTPVNAVSNADEGVWTTTGSGFIVTSTNDETVVNDLDQGTNTFTWTIRKGSCYSSATVEVTNNKPTQPVVYNASDVAIDLQDLPCQTDFTTLRGTTPNADETGYWRIESGALTIDNMNSPTINITNIAKGDHVLSWNILRGDCLLKALVTIRNNSLNVDAGNDRYSCDGTTMLNGTEVPSDAVGQWTIIEGEGYFVEGGDKASTQVTGLDQSTPGGRNIFRWTLTRNGCESYDEVIVYNDQPSAAEIAGGSSSISICDYEYTLHAVSPQYGTGVWSVVGGQGKFDNPADPNTRVYDLANGDNVFRWTVSNNTCSRFVDFTVTNLHIDAYAGADTAVCGRTAKLNATPVPDGATGQWTLVSGAAGVIFNPANTQADAFATSLGHGTNALVWTVTKDGCVSRDTVIVSNNAPFEVDASTYIYTDGNKTTLRAEIPEIGSGVWSLVEGRGEITNPTSATTEVTNLLPNYNYFRWTVSNANCVEYIDVAVQSGVLADADAGLDQMHLCEDYTTLNANEPEGTYGEWTIVEGSADFESYNNAKTRITNIRSGQNVFRWTLRFAGGSENFTTDTVIIVNNKPTDADAGLDIFECGDVATLNAREPVVGAPSWAVLSGGGVFTDNTDPKTIVTDLAKGENVFKYQIQEDICFSYDTISVFNFEPSDAYAGEDQVVCQDSAVLNPEIPKYGQGTWKIIEGSGKGKDANGNEIDQIKGGYVYSLAPGVNKLVWEVKVPEAASSCVKRDTLTIINNQPSVSFAGHDRSICTDTVSLSGSVPVYGEGTWTLLSGSGVIADSSQTNTLVTDLGVGKNRFRWTIDNNGCTSFSDVEIANNLIEAFAGYDQVNCVDTASLEGNNPVPGVGTWGIVGGSGSANFEDNESPYTEVRNLDKGENILTWTIDYKGCRSVSEVKITNNEPSQAIAGDNKATCENSIVLGAANPEVGTGSWTIRSGGGDFVDANNNSTQVNNLKFGSNVFRWTVENNGCQLYDDVEISFNRIDAVVGGTQEICADRTFLDANNASPGVGTWSVVGGSSQARFVDTHDATTEVLDLAKGNNILRWTINNEGCVTSAEVSVVNHTPSTAYAGNTQEICESTTVLDATAVSIGTGSWEVLIGAGTITSDQVNNPKADISGLSKGENVLRWTVTSDNGLCTSIDDVTVINNEPSEPYAGADEEYCSPTVVLKAAVPDFGTGNWSIIEGGGNFDDSTLPNATINNLNEGVNVLRWTISQGQCTKYSDIEVLNNTPTTANAGPDIEDCKDFAELDANLPTQGEGFWTLISGNADFIDETDAKTRVEGLTFGENILMWNVQKGGCISSDQITVFNQVPDQAQAGTDRTTCEDYLTLNANDPNTGIGTWTVISGNGEFDDVNSPTTIVRELGLGENRFKWTVAYGDCNTEDVVEVVSNKAAPYAGEDAVVYDSEFELKASNPGDLGAIWSIVAGSGDFDDNTYFNTTVRNLSEGVNTYRWLMNVNGCITYDDVSIEYRVVPDAAFVVDTTQGCYPLSIQFTNYSDGGTNFLWEFGDGYSSTDRNPVHTFDDPGIYTVTLTAPGPDGVNGIFTKDITVYDHPIAEFSYTPDVVYVPGKPLSCSSLSTGAVSYLWDFGDGNTSIEVNPFHEYSIDGTFDISLTVESQYGCKDQIVKMNAVIAKLEGFITFPTAFTPRPDGGTAVTVGGGESNEVFRPVSRDVDQYKLQIFNRWGQLIYESTDIAEGWNGFYNNALSPKGVYVWKATGTFVSGKEFTEAGSVLLVR